jgi:lipopolysaccharide/colanic/teichoic acid biosynthesis glycosyltransferase
MNSKAALDFGFLREDAFIHRLYLEQRRTERSRRPFILLLLESILLKTNLKEEVCGRILKILAKSIRETDVRGWYESRAAIGVIFTEIGSIDGRSAGDALVGKIRGLLQTELSALEVGQIRLSFYVFPEDWDKERDSSTLYPESTRKRWSARIMKRFIDVCGSLTALALSSPLLLVIAAMVKLTSKGPVFFRQERVGRHGRRFTFLKFRSMYINSDQNLHREYVKTLIAGAVTPQGDSGETKVFKLTNDPRVTNLGRFLRKTSLDEVPQFWNVLLGEMSLVGPRPPIPYEVESYDIWHRRRLLGVKPGITGLWQVNGRSRTTFDEMVRLDLQYAKSWSLWMDLKILFQTARAVAAGDGAY